MEGMSVSLDVDKLENKVIQTWTEALNTEYKIRMNKEVTQQTIVKIYGVSFCLGEWMDDIVVDWLNVFLHESVKRFKKCPYDCMYAIEFASAKDINEALPYIDELEPGV